MKKELIAAVWMVILIVTNQLFINRVAQAQTSKQTINGYKCEYLRDLFEIINRKKAEINQEQKEIENLLKLVPMGGILLTDPLGFEVNKKRDSYKEALEQQIAEYNQKRKNKNYDCPDLSMHAALF